MSIKGQVKDSSNSSQNDRLISRFYSYTLKYPKKAYENGIEGTILLTFDIDTTCSFINVKQSPKLGFGCDEVALESLLKLEKDMKKDNHNKCVVVSNREIPVTFRIK